MLQELIEKWRGIDHWQETNATVVSYEVLSEGGNKEGPPQSKITFFYHDATNSIQSGEMTVDSLTSLYNLNTNDTFQVRFNPQKPSKFYCSEAPSLFTEFRTAFWLCFAILFVIVLTIILFSRR